MTDIKYSGYDHPCARCGGELEQGDYAEIKVDGMLHEQHELRQGANLCHMCVSSIDDYIQRERRSPKQIAEDVAKDLEVMLCWECGEESPNAVEPDENAKWKCAFCGYTYD